MEFSYSFNAQDWAAAQAYIIRPKGPLGRGPTKLVNFFLKVFVAVIATSILVGLALGKGPRVSTPVVMLVICGTVMVWLFAGVWAVKAFAKRDAIKGVEDLVQRGEIDPFPVTIQARLSDEGLETASTSGQALYAWHGIRNVERVGDCLYLTINAYLCVFIPLGAVDPRDLSVAIEAECRVRVERARGRPTAPPTRPGVVPVRR